MSASEMSVIGLIVLFLVFVFGGLFYDAHMRDQRDAREDQLIAEMVKAGVPVSEAILAVREVR